MIGNTWKLPLFLLAAAVICVAGCLPEEGNGNKKSERDVDAQVDKVLDDFKGQ